MAKNTLSQQHFYSLHTVMKAAHSQSQQSHIWHTHSHPIRKIQPSTRSKKQVITNTVPQQHSRNTSKSQTNFSNTIHSRIHNLKVTQVHPNTLSHSSQSQANPRHIRGTHTITLSHRHIPSELSTRSQTHGHSSITTLSESQLTLTR